VEICFTEEGRCSARSPFFEQQARSGRCDRALGLRRRLSVLSQGARRIQKAGTCCRREPLRASRSLRKFFVTAAIISAMNSRTTCSNAQFNTHRVVRTKLQRDRRGRSNRPTKTSYSVENQDVQSDRRDRRRRRSLLVVDTGGWFASAARPRKSHKPDILGGIYRIRRTDRASELRRDLTPRNLPSCLVNGQRRKRTSSTKSRWPLRILPRISGARRSRPNTATARPFSLSQAAIDSSIMP